MITSLPPRRQDPPSPRPPKPQPGEMALPPPVFEQRSAQCPTASARRRRLGRRARWLRARRALRHLARWDQTVRPRPKEGEGSGDYVVDGLGVIRKNVVLLVYYLAGSSPRPSPLRTMRSNGAPPAPYGRRGKWRLRYWRVGIIIVMKLV